MLGWNKMFEYTFNIDFTKVSGYTALNFKSGIWPGIVNNLNVQRPSRTDGVVFTGCLDDLKNILVCLYNLLRKGMVVEVFKGFGVNGRGFEYRYLGDNICKIRSSCSLDSSLWAHGCLKNRESSSSSFLSSIEYLPS